MKKAFTLLIAISFIAGAFTFANAEEISIEERMNTEGKILATMNLHKEDMLSQMEALHDEVLVAQDTIGLETNVSGDSKGKLSALGQIEYVMNLRIEQAKRTSAEDYNRLSALFDEVKALNTQALLIAK